MGWLIALAAYFFSSMRGDDESEKEPLGPDMLGPVDRSQSVDDASARSAATSLATYLRSAEPAVRSGAYSPVVERYQRAMGVAADGRVGPQTRTRARALGVELPSSVDAYDGGSL